MKSAPFALLLFLTAFASAKSADDYYHGSGYKYIAGRQQEASVEVEEGLRNFPGDPRLQGLASLLKKMQDQQRQDQNQEGGGEKKPEENPENKKDEKTGEKQPDKNPQDSSGQEDKKQPDKEGKKPPQDSSGKDSQAEQARPKPGQMSKEEAEQLLNSFADDEKKEQRKLRKHPGKQPQVEQDW